MPDWLTAVLTQYPVAVVIGLVAWYAHKQLRIGHTEQRKRDDEHFTARLAEMKANHDATVAAKDAEIRRLSRINLGQLKRLTETVHALAAAVGKSPEGTS